MPRPEYTGPCADVDIVGGEVPPNTAGASWIWPAARVDTAARAFTACSAAAGILRVDAEFALQCVKALERLPRPSVGGLGQLMEWASDHDEAEPGHRHLSHLFALLPGEQITVRGTPDLARACRVALERRLEAGGGHTGWSTA